VLRLGLAVDGEFGPKTTAVVKAFQRKAAGLLVGGEYGPKTAGKLHAVRERIR
jgi:peptidoglycan hydrolase-like protein with peptidoglycan-binding domain